jgi:hypothetical protein
MLESERVDLRQQLVVEENVYQFVHDVGIVKRGVRAFSAPTRRGL